MRRLSIFILFMASLGAGLFFNQAGLNREVFRSVCDLTETNFYKSGPALDEWVATCRRLAASVPTSLSARELADEIQNHMSRLDVSHFQIYSPAEDKKMWTGRAVDTGLRTRYVDDHLLVYRVLSESPAEKAGLRAGDEILQISGTEQVTPWGAQNRSGTFLISRGAKKWEVELEAAELSVDGAPQVLTLAPGLGLLEISSFRSEYFDGEEWRKKVAELKAFQHLIIDIRDNPGGNFVAMLRALSTFKCREVQVGQLLRPRSDGKHKEGFADNTEDAYQIDEIARYRSLALRTFENYGCFTGQVTVLINSDTSSVAEIFAHSFLSAPRSRVWGQPTSGDVVLAVWYDLPALGPGYSLSIPEAVYLTPNAEELERRGVSPEREIFYDLKEARRGLDTFIEKAKQF